MSRLPGDAGLDSGAAAGTLSHMPAKVRDKKLEADLTSMLAEEFPGLNVTIEHSDRWNRVCATFVWSGFADLLPEERFQRLVRLIPEDFREKRLAGLVWLELAPGESVEAFLKLPRSEDFAAREADVYAELESAGFFEALEKALGPEPQKACQGQFTELGVVLSRKKYSKKRIRDAKLLFILNGAYCDCQALLTVRRELSRLHPPT